MRKRSSAFTLIELVVVIMIVAILAAVLFPAFASAKRSAYGSQCISNVYQLTAATLLYSGDNDDLIPSAADPIVKGEIADTPTCFTDEQKTVLVAMPNLKDLLTVYGAIPTQWQCPLDEIDPLLGAFDGRKTTWFAEDGSSYLFDDIDALSAIDLSSVGDPSTRLLISDEESFHGSGDMGNMDVVAKEARMNCTFFDGHAKTASPATVQRYRKTEGCWF